MKNSKNRKCEKPMHVRVAGRNLRLRGSSRAGKILATDGKNAKRIRLDKGCVDGLSGVVKLKTTKTKSGVKKTLYAVPVSQLNKLTKNKSKRKGLSGTRGTFRLSREQKATLSVPMQRGLVNYHRKMGKKILS